MSSGSLSSATEVQRLVGSVVDALGVVSAPVPVRFGVAARTLTTFGVGGALSALLEVNGVEDLSRLRAAFSAHGVGQRIFGGGSNLLIRDEGVFQPVVALGRRFAGWRPVEGAESFRASFDRMLECVHEPTAVALPRQGEEVRVFALAATPLMALSRQLCERGIGGLEFAAGIPAQVGGAVRMNAGAHGRSLGELLSAVYYLDGVGEPQATEELTWGYRSCSLPFDAIVIAAEFRCKMSAPVDVQNERRRCLDYRKKTQPLHLPSAGSIFRNPSGVTAGAGALPSAGSLLEQCGFKGRSRAGVGFSELHANWLVRLGEPAPAVAALELIEEAIESVRSQFRIELSPELVIW